MIIIYLFESQKLNNIFDINCKANIDILFDFRINYIYIKNIIIIKYIILRYGHISDNIIIIRNITVFITYDCIKK